jgi:hypothetical protein
LYGIGITFKAVGGSGIGFVGCVLGAGMETLVEQGVYKQQ